MNKRGQFYLVAAIILVVIMASVTSVTTYAITRTTGRNIQDLGSDLKGETSNIIEYGIYNGQDLRQLLDKFTEEDFAPYFLQKTDNANVMFIYGNQSELYGVRYDTIKTGTITANLGSASTSWTNAGLYANRTIITDDDGDGKITVTMQGPDFDRSFDFTLQDNEMFYFVMLQETEGEIHIEIKDK